jgi:hypothetical protein
LTEAPVCRWLTGYAEGTVKSDALAGKLPFDPSLTLRLPIDFGPAEDRSSEFAKHHVRVGVPAIRVEERLGEIPYDPEPMPLPEPHGPAVGADHKVELHRLEPSAASMLD